MSLASISFTSVQNALYSSYNGASTAPSSRVTVASAPVRVVPVASAAGEGGTVLARHFGTVLNALATGDATGAKIAVASFQKSLGQNGGGQGEGLSQVLGTVSRSLESTGSTTQALGHVQSFLLNAGQTTGTGFSARV